MFYSSRSSSFLKKTHEEEAKPKNISNTKEDMHMNIDHKKLSIESHGADDNDSKKHSTGLNNITDATPTQITQTSIDANTKQKVNFKLRNIYPS